MSAKGTPVRPYRSVVFLSMRIARTRILGSLCACIVVGLLALGLWPFHQPKNQVRWLASRHGLALGARNSIWSTDVVKRTNASGDDGSCSIEVWLQPSVTNDTGVILAFYDPETGQLFSVNQELTDLVIRREERRGWRRTVSKKGYAEEIFHANRPVFITITSGIQGTMVYADGSPFKTLASFRFSSKDFVGRLTVGDSPVTSHGWSGQLRGLALYRQDLTAAQVRRHYDEWTRAGRPDLADTPRLFSLYLFAEGTGNVAHSASATGVPLFIPARYSIVNKILLEAPWNAFRGTWDYWRDIAINVGGFVPLGLFAAAYLSLRMPNRWATIGAIALGAAISLTIESVQVFLPTRDSDMTDVITNTLGTCIGAAMLQWSPVRCALDYVLDLWELVARRLPI